MFSICDIAKQNSRIEPIKRNLELSRPKPSHKLVKMVAKMIVEAKQPLLLLGNGVIRGNASASFVENTGMYSMNTFMAKGIISDKSEKHLQTIGIKEADHSQIAMKVADLVIAVGYDLVEYSPKKWNRDLKKKIIHIDFTYAEVDTYYPPTVEIAADIEYTIDVILDELQKQRKKENHNLGKFPRYGKAPHLFKKIKQEIVWRANRFNNDFSYPIKPQKLLQDVRNALGEKDIVISDVRAHKLWIAKVYDTFSPNTCLITNGFCSMGFALPGAIAAQLARPNEKIVAMCGDGGFLMNVQEIETADELKLPIIIIVWCDCDFGMISLKLIDEFGKSAFTRFNNPNFVTLAQSFGAIGYDVKSTKDFSNILEKAKESTSVPVIISVGVDYSRNRILLDDNFIG
jgi:acetolactate synthase I/II/III large subunit